MNNNIKIIEGGVCAVDGVKASGLRNGKYGIAVIEAKNSNAAGVYTSNKLSAAPVQYTKSILEDNNLSAIVANSGNANCFTGKEGEEDCKTLVSKTSKLLNIPENEIAASSTGVIGRKMPMDIFNSLLDEVAPNIKHSSKGSHDAALAIMTTDTVPKEIAVELNINGEKVTIGAMSKGTGMIAPNMATLFCFIFTDAIIPKEYIKKALKTAMDLSLNMIVVDGDESTNDTAILMANGKSNVNVVSDNEINQDFQDALNYVSIELAKKMVTDGEGATKLIEVNVNGAKSLEDAKLASKSVITSPLFKTAVFGADPNWGRIAAAIGYSGSEMDSDIISISITNNTEEAKSVELVKNGKPLAFEGTQNLKEAEEIMSGEYIIIDIDLNLGIYKARAWGCDLSYDYVKINGEYTT